MKNQNYKKLALMAVILLIGVYCFAQTKKSDAPVDISDVVTQAKTTGDSIKSLMKWISGVGLLGTGVMAGIKLASEDQQAKKGVTGWIVACIFLAIVFGVTTIA